MRMRWVRRGAIGLAVLTVASLAVGAMGDWSSRDASSQGSIHGPVTAGDQLLTSGQGSAAEGDYAAQVRGVLTDDAAVSPGGPVAASASGPVPGFGDRVIRMSSLQIEVREGGFNAAWQRARDIATRFGGEVVGESRGEAGPLSEDREAVPSGTLTIRVPSSRLDQAVTELGSALGDVRAQQTSSEDVSQEYVDLRSRLRNLRAERDALLTLYGRADSIRDTLAVQNRLSEVQGEIEQVTGRITFIERSTDFSTITLTLAEPGAAALSLIVDDGPSFAQAWDTALEGLVRIATTAMITLIWLAPFALVAALLMGMWRRMRPTQQA